jgi:hypothetical protein
VFCRPWGIDVELYDYDQDFDISFEDYLGETARLNTNRLKNAAMFGSSSVLGSPGSQDITRPTSPTTIDISPSKSLSKSLSASRSRPTSPSMSIHRSNTVESSISGSAQL